jgi:hypothetical protein
MLLMPNLLASPTMWLAGLTAMVVCHWPDWYSLDNHKYLMTYWVLACFLSTARRADLQSSARTLVGITFVLATTWKILGGQYLNGSFLHAAFLTEPRLIPIGVAFARVPAEALSSGPAAVQALLMFGRPHAVVLLPSTTLLDVMTVSLSWFAIALEGSFGVLHFVTSRTAYQIRHTLLIGFIFFTYLVFPVTGFAFVLAILGLTECETDDLTTKIAYLGLGAFVQLTIVPWRTLL